MRDLSTDFVLDFSNASRCDLTSHRSSKPPPGWRQFVSIDRYNDKCTTMAQRSKRRDLLCAAISAALGILAFIQCQIQTKEMMEPTMDYCVNGAEAYAASNKAKGPIQLAGYDAMPYESRLGGWLVGIITQFIYRLTQNGPAGFIAWTTTIVASLPLGMLMSVESGRSGAKGPVLYPTIIGLLAQFLGISVSFPVIWVPGYLLLGGSRTSAVPSLRPYVAVYLLPPIIALTYLAFNLDPASYEWTLTAGTLGGPLLPMLSLLLWRLKPKSAADVTPQDVSRGAIASSNCYLIVSFVSMAVWGTVLRAILEEYGLSSDVMKAGLWFDADPSVRFMVIDAVVLFAGALAYVASVDPIDSVAALLISPIIGPGASVGLMLWGHERLRDGKVKAALKIASEQKQIQAKKKK